MEEIAFVAVIVPRQVNARPSIPLPLPLLGAQMEKTIYKERKFSSIPTEKKEPQEPFLSGNYFLFGPVRKHVYYQKK